MTESFSLCVKEGHHEKIIPKKPFYFRPFTCFYAFIGYYRLFHCVLCLPYFWCAIKNNPGLEVKGGIALI